MRISDGDARNHARSPWFCVYAHTDYTYTHTHTHTHTHIEYTSNTNMNTNTNRCLRLVKNYIIRLRLRPVVIPSPSFSLPTIQPPGRRRRSCVLNIPTGLALAKLTMWHTPQVPFGQASVPPFPARPKRRFRRDFVDRLRLRVRSDGAGRGMRRGKKR